MNKTWDSGPIPVGLNPPLARPPGCILVRLEGVRVRVLQVPALALTSRLCAVYRTTIILAIAPNTSSWRQKTNEFLDWSEPIPPSPNLTWCYLPSWQDLMPQLWKRTVRFVV
jgi:hypothetical protein